MHQFDAGSCINLDHLVGLLVQKARENRIARRLQRPGHIGGQGDQRPFEDIGKDQIKGGSFGQLGMIKACGLNTGHAARQIVGIDIGLRHFDRDLIDVTGQYRLGPDARGGHGQTVATPATLAIMELRYATKEGATPVEYGETISLPGGVEATYIPAGHVLGSAQILLEHAGERVVVTGDYKRRADPTCPPFQVTPCDIFITEATFGLPVFCHPPIEEEMAKLLERLAAHPDRCVLVGAYALGKAQRVIAELRRAGHMDPIYLHGAMEKMCRLCLLYTSDAADE